MLVVAFLSFVLIYILTVSVEYCMINRTSEKMVFQAVGAEVKGWMEGIFWNSFTAEDNAWVNRP